MTKTIVFYHADGAIDGATVCADDHADLQWHPHTDLALILDGAVQIDFRNTVVRDGVLVSRLADTVAELHAARAAKLEDLNAAFQSAFAAQAAPARNLGLKLHRLVAEVDGASTLADLAAITW
jgi:hypothetical protein